MARYLSVETDGWVRYLVDGYVPGEVRLRVQELDGRLRVIELKMDSETGLTARMLRDVPIGWVETVVNQPEVRRLIQTGAPADDPSPVTTRPRSLRLKIPTERPYGEAFYVRIGHLYRGLAAGGRPAVEIAEANGVPVGTVHGWIREARRRGLLPPARQGTRG